MLDEFLAISELLTGVHGLDRAVGGQHLDRFTRAGHEFGPIADRYRALKAAGASDDAVGRALLADDALRPAISQLVLVWYTSALEDASASPALMRYGSPEAYFSALGWRVIGAHAPGLSGGYFGHWRYRPDNEPPGAA